jgi:A/G-specific adenine glycosylase
VGGHLRRGLQYPVIRTSLQNRKQQRANCKELKSRVAKALFRRRLLGWYDRNKRDLPWRHNRDPYRVWLSEIMLQQTRVAAVIDHYRRFLDRFPTIEKLAAASEASVLAVWGGLGYYRRARMLHLAAKEIVDEHRGESPTSAESLRELPGIGRYTAAAISSIAFDEPIAAVDGNVERILRRITGADLVLAQVWELADILLSRKHPGDFNQAMMELGALVCLPRNPKCMACPIFDFCRTRGESKTQGKTIPQRKKEICYAIARQRQSVFLVQRSEDASVMAGMWEFPEIGNKGADFEITLRHSITVTDYVVRVAYARSSPRHASGKWVLESQLNEIALTGLARKILRAAKII